VHIIIIIYWTRPVCASGGIDRIRGFDAIILTLYVFLPIWIESCYGSDLPSWYVNCIDFPTDWFWSPYFWFSHFRRGTIRQNHLTNLARGGSTLTYYFPERSENFWNRLPSHCRHYMDIKMRYNDRFNVNFTLSHSCKYCFWAHAP